MASSCSQTPFLIEQKPLMLKDYLLDDLSSCSSNGFKSCPRQQCCTTVRFLLEDDLTSSVPKQQRLQQQQQRRLFKRSCSSKAAPTASTSISVLQKASASVITAVKLLPFPSSVHNRVAKASLLPTSISRKTFKKTFWKKTDHKDESEFKRWRSFPNFLNKKQEPSDQYPTSIPPTVDPPTARIPTNSSGNIDSNSKNNSCVNKHYGASNDALGGEKNSSNDSQVGERAGVKDGQDSVSYSSTAIAKVWSNEEEKEQFSPVSVLDCPFQDEEEEETGSHFQRSCVRLEGTKQKPMQKLRRIGDLAQIEPVDLEKRIALTIELDDEPLGSSTQAFPVAIHKSNNMMSNEIQDENGIEKGVQDLLMLVKAIPPPNSLLSKAHNDLFLDFFREKMVENRTSGSMVSKGEKELKGVQDWINGQSQEMFLGWEVEEGRHSYMIEMEKNGKWRNMGEEIEELTLELELEIFSSLLSDASVDLF